MESKIRFRYNPNGTIDEVVSADNKLFAGGKGVNEYYLSMAVPDNPENWLPTDRVFIVFTRNDNKTSKPQAMHYDYNENNWQIVTNGWETDVETLGKSVPLKIGFVMRRYSTTQAGEIVKTRTADPVTIQVHDADHFVPYEIPSSTLDAMLVSMSSTEQKVQEALELVQSVRDDADSGKFVGSIDLEARELLGQIDDKIESLDDALGNIEIVLVIEEITE